MLKVFLQNLSGSQSHSTSLPIALSSQMLSASVITFWKANKKSYISSKFHFNPIKFVFLGEVRSLCSSFWVAADHSSLKHSQNLHTSLESSENTLKGSATHQCIIPLIFIFIAFFNKIQWLIKVSASYTLAHYSKTSKE